MGGGGSYLPEYFNLSVWPLRIFEMFKKVKCQGKKKKILLKKIHKIFRGGHTE